MARKQKSGKQKDSGKKENPTIKKDEKNKNRPTKRKVKHQNTKQTEQGDNYKLRNDKNKKIQKKKAIPKAKAQVVQPQNFLKQNKNKPISAFSQFKRHKFTQQQRYQKAPKSYRSIKTKQVIIIKDNNNKVDEQNKPRIEICKKQYQNHNSHIESSQLQQSIKINTKKAQVMQQSKIYRNNQHVTPPSPPYPSYSPYQLHPTYNPSTQMHQNQLVSILPYPFIPYGPYCGYPPDIQNFQCMPFIQYGQQPRQVSNSINSYCENNNSLNSAIHNEQNQRSIVKLQQISQEYSSSSQRRSSKK